MTRRCLGAYPGRQDERLNAMARMRAALCWCVCVCTGVCVHYPAMTLRSLPTQHATRRRQWNRNEISRSTSKYVYKWRKRESEREWEREAHNEAEIINELNRAIYT